MEKRIKLTKVETIGRVVKGLQEFFPNLNWKRTYEEKHTKRLPRKQEYSAEGIKILLECPTKHNVVRRINAEYDDERAENLIYQGLKFAEAI